MKHICVFGFLLDGAEHPFQQYISYIVAVSFFVGGPGEKKSGCVCRYIVYM
jgi:hypothetical protein